MELVNYLSLLPTTYKVLLNILPSELTPYVKKITGVYHCEFRRNVSTTDHIYCIRQILEKNGTIMGQYISYL
jgi:Mg2+/citrate symporter